MYKIGENQSEKAKHYIEQKFDLMTAEKYKYTSLEELNAVLRLYNVEAYRGKEDSKLYQRHGLLYRVLDEQGSYIGVPLKAIFFDFRSKCVFSSEDLDEKCNKQALQQMIHREQTLQQQLTQQQTLKQSQKQRHRHRHQF